MSKWMEINIAFEGLDTLARYCISIGNFNHIDTVQAIKMFNHITV